MKRSKLKLFIAGTIAFIVGFLTTLRSANAQQPERFDNKVRDYFFTGFAGDQEALAQGMKISETVLAADPKQPEALVWHGAGLMFRSGQAFQSGNQQKGVELWTQGLKEMQTAVDLTPDSVSVRVPRGANLLAMTRYLPDQSMAMPLIKEGVADYERAYQVQKPIFRTLATHSRGELLFGIAEGYSRLGDQEKAKAYFEQIRTDLPDSQYAKRAALWLETKSLPANQTRCIGCHSPAN